MKWLSGLRVFSPRVVLWLTLGLGFAARAVGAFDDGIFWPDEVYQSFEPAHAFVFGHGLIPWEFVEGARTWALPGFVAALLKTCAVLGLDSPTVYVRVVKLAFALLSVLTALGVHRLARAFGAPEEGAVAAAALWALAAPVIYFASRATSENACCVPLVWGLALLFEAKSPSARRVLLASSLLGLAVLLRLQCAVLALGTVGVLAARKDWRTLGLALAGLGAWAVVYGALDAATWHDAPGARWGGWFHSAIVYVRFNVLENRGTQWGTSPWWFYARYVGSSMPTVALTMALGIAIALHRRMWALPVLVGLFALVHVVSPHKELRFILPALPLAAACVGVALASASKFRARLAQLAVLFGLASLVQAPFLTMGQMGAYLDRPKSRAWGNSAPANRLLLAASARDDVCGVRVDLVDLAWVGGSTYLHRPAPLYRPSEPGDRGHFNYLLARDGLPQLEKVAADSGLALYRGSRTCVPDPGFPWRL
jgi:GPI mannosyltransferase 3